MADEFTAFVQSLVGEDVSVRKDTGRYTVELLRKRAHGPLPTPPPPKLDGCQT